MWENLVHLLVQISVLLGAWIVGALLGRWIRGIINARLKGIVASRADTPAAFWQPLDQSFAFDLECLS